MKQLDCLLSISEVIITINYHYFHNVIKPPTTSYDRHALRTEMSRRISNRDNMTPTIRKRKKPSYISLVLEAVKVLAKGKDRGVSRQNIVKYLERKLHDDTNSVNNLPSPNEAAVKSAILTALNSGFLVQSSGVGLKGSYVLNPDRNVHCDKQKAIITKEAKLKNITSLATHLQESTSNQSGPSKVENSSKRQRITKGGLPSGDLVETGGQFASTENTTALKTILKPPSRAKLTSRLKRKSGSKRVKFRSPAKVIRISPCIKKRSQRRK